MSEEGGGGGVGGGVEMGKEMCTSLKGGMEEVGHVSRKEEEVDKRRETGKRSGRDN